MNIDLLLSNLDSEYVKYRENKLKGLKSVVRYLGK